MFKFFRGSVSSGASMLRRYCYLLLLRIKLQPLKKKFQPPHPIKKEHNSLKRPQTWHSSQQFLPASIESAHNFSIPLSGHPLTIIFHRKSASFRWTVPKMARYFVRQPTNCSKRDGRARVANSWTRNREPIGGEIVRDGSSALPRQPDGSKLDSQVGSRELFRELSPFSPAGRTSFPSGPRRSPLVPPWFPLAPWLETAAMPTRKPGGDPAGATGPIKPPICRAIRGKTRTLPRGYLQPAASGKERETTKQKRVPSFFGWEGMYEWMKSEEILEKSSRVKVWR